MTCKHDTEKWLPVTVPGFENLYKISSRGRVFSHQSNRVLKPWRAARMKYQMVALHNGKATSKQYIHRLVLLAFVGPCPEGMESCHKDGNKDNNHYSNLRWDTPQNNVKDVDIHGHRKLGSGHWRSILTEADVLKIRSIPFKRGTIKVLAREYAVDPETIRDAIHRRTWRHI